VNLTAVHQGVSHPRHSKPEQPQARAVLCPQVQHSLQPALGCARTSSVAFSPCWAAQSPRRWDKPGHLAITEKPMGSSSWAPAIVSTTWPCLYLKPQREGLMQTSFRNRAVFIQLFNTLKDQKGRISPCRDLPWENPPGACPMLRKSGVPSV